MVKPLEQKLKILHLEDLFSDAELVNNALKKGHLNFERLVVDSKDKFINGLRSYAPDVILADHSLPSFNSQEALDIFHETGMKIPFILVTAAMSDEFAVDMIRNGVDDYILKDRLNRLPSAIQNALQKFNLEKHSALFIEELKNNEKHYRALAQNSADAVVILDVNGKQTYVSPSIERVLGYTEAEAMLLEDIYEIVHPDDKDGAIKKMTECFQTPGIPIDGHVARLKHKNGSWIWTEATLTNLLNDPNINGIVDNFRDITFRKHAEEKLVNANRLYAFISQINQTIVHSKDKETVFKEACRVAIEIGKFKAAWIGLFDYKQNTISLTNEHGLLTEDLTKFITAPWEDVGAQKQVLQHNTHYVCNDTQNHLQMDNWKSFAVARGYNSMIILPIRKAGDIIGTFNIYATDIDFFTTQEIALLEEATSDISFSLDVFEKEELRKRSEKRLRHKQQRLKQAQSIAHLGSWELNFATGRASWSEEMLRIYGLEAKATTQTYATWLSFIHPEDVKHVVQMHEEGIANQKDIAFFHRIIRSDGIVRYLHSQAQFIFGERGEAIGLSGVAHDVTAIKLAEEALRKSEIFNKGVLASLSSHIAVIDERGVIIAVNKAWDDFAMENGSTSLAKTSIGSNYFDVCLESLADGEPHAGIAMAGIRSVFNKERQFFDMEYACHSAEQQRWFTLRVMNLGSDESKIVLSHQNITEIKQIEIAFKKSEFKYRKIVETAQEGIWVVDENNVTTFANKKMHDILEYPNGGMIGKKNTFFMDDDSKVLALKSFERRMAGVAETIDLAFVTKSGRQIKTRVSLNTVFDENEKYEGTLAMVSDITEKFLADEMLLESEQRYREIAYEMQLESSRLIEAQAVAKVGSWETDLQTLKVLWSDETFRIFGTDSRRFQATHSTFLNFVHPDDRKRVDDAFTLSFKTNSSNSIEHKIISAQGEVKHVIEHWKIILNEKGHATRAVGTCQDITLSKKAEEEDRFKANLLNTIGQAVVATSLDGRVNYWNNAAEKIYGYTSDEVIGKNIMDLTPSLQSKEQAAEIIELLQLGQSWTGEFKVQRKDGSEFPAYITDSPIYNDKNELTGIIGISSDITEKKELEDLLEKTNKLARVGQWEADLVNNTLYWSEVTRQIYEVEHDFKPDLKTAIDFYKIGSSRNSINGAIQDSITHGTSWDLELEIITANGNARWIRAIGEAEFINDKCEKIYGSFQDIDRRKKSELEILKVYEERNIILESINDGFYALDKDWNVTYWNKGAEVILHKQRSDIVGKNIWREYPDTTQTPFYTFYQSAVAENKAYRFEERYEMLDLWLEVSVYPSLNGLSVFFKDITERKLSEKKLITLNNDLEAYTKELVISNKDLEQFSYIISHNLRAPVANIIGLAEQLIDDTLTVDTKHLLNNALTASVRNLDNVIIDLNSILQIKKEITEKKEVVGLNELILDIKSSILNLFEDEKVSIKTDFSEINKFTTLRTYLYSIFYNLITNSIKYRQPNLHPHIEIKSRRLDQKLVITFKDNGLGIDLTKKGDQVFGLYKRFHKNIEGKGMGLFMVKTQVETLGGKIFITSEVNKGTEFRMEFKL